MKVKLYFTGCLILLFAVSSIAQKTTITFSNKTYQNDSISVYCFSDYITETKKQLASGKVSDSGYFGCSFKINTITQVFIPIGIFQLSLYTEPGKTYHLLIPPKKKLDVADELNPFFVPVEILPGIKGTDSTELNSLINSFDIKYENFISKNFKYIYYSARKSVPDSAIASLEKQFSWTHNLFFKKYIEFKFNMLRYMAYERDDSYIIKYRFNNQSVYLNNPSYMSMFNDLFKHYFSVSVSKNWGDKIMDDIAKSKSPWELHQTFKFNPALSNDTLIDLIILKGIHDAFYADKISEYRTFPRKQLLMTLDSMICCAMAPEYKQIAQNIKTKVIQMSPGGDAPDFSLPNLDSVPINLSELRGKYLYINFNDIRSYSCQNEMTLLSTISKKFPKELEIVTIMCNGTVSQVREFCKINDFKWQFLAAEKPGQVINNYHIKALPSYFLIDPYGKIVLSPCPGPDSNFGSVFVSILNGRN